MIWQTLLRLGLGLALGAVGGAVYGFLRPLRARSGTLADGLFVAVFFYLWLELSFRVCRADIRLGYTLSLPLGAVAFDRTLGRVLRQPFEWFWRGIFWVFRMIFLPMRKFFQKIK